MEKFPIVYWASVVAVLGLMYAAFASLWLVLFDRGVVEHGIREESGYRIGSVVYWRLPRCAFLLVVSLAGIPILAVTFLEGWLVRVILAVITGIMVSLWLIASPGTRLLYAAQSQAEGQAGWTLQRSGNIVRSLIVFVVFGMLPALTIGALLNWLLARFII